MTLDELRALSDAATVGPWSARKIEDSADDWWSIDAPGEPPSLGLVGAEDAAFIVAAVNFVREQLAARVAGEAREP